jgi:hypothetical protein
MRVIVCGGRNFNNESWIDSNLDKFKITEVATGGAKGVDSLAEKWASKRSIPFTVFPARWDEFSNAAGQIRNKQMYCEFKPDAVIAFATGCGNGTINMINLAKKGNTRVIVINEGSIIDSDNETVKLFQGE